MRSSAPYLSPSEAALCLGVSAKALRLYEQHGLVSPLRTASGWRAYGPADMERARAIVTLRGLGLGLPEIKRALAGDPEGLAPVLAAHQGALEDRALQIRDTIGKLRVLRNGLQAGDGSSVLKQAGSAAKYPVPSIAFDLPWPWGGERFELFDPQPVTYIVGPLGSGKTRFARAIANALPSAAFIGLDRLEDDCSGARAKITADPSLEMRVDESMRQLKEQGAAASQALTALLVALEISEEVVLVIDMVEQGLDRATQEALGICLRKQQITQRPLFLMTRSSSILDLAAVSSETAIILCPANHSPPVMVSPYPGAPGHEAVATCLATPEVRARTEGVIAWRPPQPA